MNVKKLKAKQTRYRCLKTISYLLGFPLFFVLVFVGSIPFFAGDGFGSAKWTGIAVALGVWLFSVVLQLVIGKTLKTYNGRTIVTLVASLILVIGVSVAFDLAADSKIGKIKEDYEKLGVEVKPYKYQAGYYDTRTSGKESLTDKYNKDVYDFCLTYNIGYKSQNFGDKNHDGSPVTYNKKDDAYYSPNGMYADGYVFGFKQALKVLTDYYESKAAIEAADTEKRTADEILEAALKDLDDDPDWTAYKNEDEYKKAYSPDGPGYRFKLNEERLNKILESLGESLAPVAKLPMVGGKLAEMGITEESLDNLNLEGLLNLINDMEILSEPLTAPALMDVLEDFSFYQVPTLRPKFDFLKDADLKRFAYARYYATVHGASVGSVLIGDRIGKVDMTHNGFEGEKGYALNQLYDLRARNEIAVKYYPMTAYRNYAYVCAGIIALMTILTYHWKRKEDEAFAESVTGKGGYR